MLNRFVRKAAKGLSVVAERASAAIFQGSLLLDLGPRAYAIRRDSLRRWRAYDGATFMNGISTSLTPSRAAGWYHVEGHPLVVGVYGDPTKDIEGWLTDVQRKLGAHIIFSAPLASHTEVLSEDVWTVLDSSSADGLDLAEVLQTMHRRHRNWDLVLVDVRHSLPSVEDLIRLQYAAYEYHPEEEAGFVSPAYRTSAGVMAGYQFDRRTGEIAGSPVGTRDYGQDAIARYVLTAPAHGFYATSAAIDRVDVPGRHLAGLNLDAQVAQLVRRGWAGNVRALCFAPVVLDVQEIPQLSLSEDSRKWLMERVVKGDGGRVNVIFVLPATSISGGIRAVFEIANGLAQRDMDVEVWSLQETPDWFDLLVPVRTFDSYGDLLLSLRNADAIKVATWWESAEIVWLGSVNHGIPVYLIQEFETWFFPGDPIGQAAVAASYRQEFIGITEASYQQGELEEIGARATMIPHGYDSSVFRVLADHPREQDTVLALGRSFFQKNFAMTARAWRSMGERRPKLLLFGTEPDILVDPRVDYRVRPRDPEVNELYNSATVFVQTSRHEGFCLPVLEAMAAGCPVITTDSHGNRDFCRDGENCIIVPQDDADALVSALDRLLGDPEEQERLRQGGLETAARYTWPLVLDDVAAFYERVAATGEEGSVFTEGADDARAR